MILCEPRVLLCGKAETVTLHARNPIFEEGCTALLTSCERFRNEKTAVETEMISGFPVSHTTNKPRPLGLELVDAYTARCTLCFAAEQEYILRIFRAQGSKPAGTAYLYALREDLYGFHPYKGDFHLHSWCSDGEDAPEQVAEGCRKMGFDFMALTDHGKFEPSVRLRNAARGRKNGLEVFTGEEIHLPYHQAHILNIGGERSVNDAFRNDRDGFTRDLDKLAETTEIPETVDAYQFLSALWAFQKVREYGGMSVFCHPYWRRASGYELCADFTEVMLELQPFDALELISGYVKRESSSNVLQVARYYELEHKPPVVGVSDAHTVYRDQVPEGEFLLGSFYTWVLARSNRVEDVCEAVKEYRSVAVEHLEGEQVRMYGPYRLVKFFLFLGRI